MIDKDTDNQHSTNMINKDKTNIINNDRTVIASLVDKHTRQKMRIRKDTDNQHRKKMIYNKTKKGITENQE